MPETLLCVHRGGGDDPSMYWCQGTINADGGVTWSADERFMDGNTKCSEGVGLARFRDTIYCTHRDSESGHLMLTYWDASLREWRPRREPLTTAQSCTPTLSVRRFPDGYDELYCFYESDNTGQIYWAASQWPLDYWGFNFLAANKMTNRAMGVQFGDTMYCVHRGKGDKGGSNECYWALQNTDNNWGDDHGFGVHSANGPAAAIFDNKLFLVRRGKDGDRCIYTNRYVKNTDKSLSEVGGENVTNNQSDVGPTLIVGNGSLYCVYPSTDNQRLRWARWQADSLSWTDGVDTGGQRSAGEVGLLAIPAPL